MNGPFRAFAPCSRPSFSNSNTTRFYSLSPASFNAKRTADQRTDNPRQSVCDGTVSSIRPEKILQPVGRCPDRARQTEFRDIVGKDAVDIVKFRSGHGVLRLDKFDIVRYAGLVPLAWEDEVVLGYVTILLSDLNLG